MAKTSTGRGGLVTWKDVSGWQGAVGCDRSPQTVSKRKAPVKRTNQQPSKKAKLDREMIEI